MRKRSLLPRSIILATLAALVLGSAVAGCGVGREDRPVDLLGRRKCDEWLRQLDRKMADVRLVTQGTSDLFRITEAIHDARDKINTLKGSCARQSNVSEQVQEYERQLDAIEDQQVWGGGVP